MPSDVWNFRGYIAVPLEHYAKEVLPNSSFSADGIETGDFINAMCAILDKLQIRNKENFIASCAAYRGKTATQIGDETAQKIFREFCALTDCPYGK